MAAQQQQQQQQLPSQLSSAHSLPYPERFEMADRFAQQEQTGLSQESQLMLYALKQQATQGPCTKSAGWGWSVVESAKLQAWKQLGNMSTMEAMRLFVRTLDEERPDWFAALQASASSSSNAAPPAPTTPTHAAADAPQANGAAAASAATPAAAAGTPLKEGGGAAAFVPAPVASHAAEGAWATVPTGAAAGRSKGPCPRYEHGAAVLGDAIFVVGGNYAGRYLADVWRLDLATSVWTPLVAGGLASVSSLGNGGSSGALAPAEPSERTSGDGSGPSGLLPLAGHSVTPWGDRLLLLGGHVKAKTADAAGALPVRAFSPATGALTALEPQGSAKLPKARGGHSATLVGQELWVFGGEDATRRPLDDLFCLDLGGLVWSQPLVRDEAPAKRGSAAPPWPSARSAHAAAAYLNRFVVVFGGGSAATCFSDVHVLDTRAPAGDGKTAPTWLSVKTTGHAVTPRAGHSAVVYGDVLCVVGGGNNVRGCTDTLGLDLTPLKALAQAPPGSASPVGPVHLTWHSLGSTPPRDPLSSEGVSLLLLPPAGGGNARPALAAFGGYNGKYHGVLKVTLAPQLQPPAQGAAAAAAAAPPAAAPPSQKPQQQASQQQPAAAAKPAAAKAAESNGAVAAVAGGAKQLSEAELLRAEVARLQSALAAAREEAETAIKAAAATAAAESHELSLLRKQLATTQASLETASKGLDDARAALGRESAKVVRLEVEIAELNKRLAVEAEARKELEALRRQIKEAEAKKGSGIWGFVTGSS